MDADDQMGFGERLREAIARRGRLCVGIDPHPELLTAWGLTRDAAGLERFALTVVDALADRTALLKPQSAFFEAHGSAGVAVLEKTMRRAREAGALVLLDAKRGDIGSTMAAYAQAYLAEDAPLACDALTLSPYLGFEALAPAIDTALAAGRGVFVLARTSNAEGGPVQQARVPAGETLAQAVVDAAARRNDAGAAAGAAPCADRPWGSVGVVVGATAAHGLRLRHLNGPILAPGYGAQGATSASLRDTFVNEFDLVVPTTSRQVLRSGPEISSLRRAAAAAAVEIAAVADSPTVTAASG